MKLQKRLGRLRVILKAGLTYFGLVFGTGFILGTIRVLFIVPRFGARLAELIEWPLMLTVTILAASWVVRRFRVSVGASDRIAVGLLAIILLIALELTIVLWLRGLSLGDYFRERDPVAGTVYYLLLVYCGDAVTCRTKTRTRRRLISLRRQPNKSLGASGTRGLLSTTCP
jgi:hypothetical protein